MLDNSTIERLKAMKMNAFAVELEHQLSDSDSYSRLGFEERLGLWEVHADGSETLTYTFSLMNIFNVDKNSFIRGNNLEPV